MRRLLVPEVVQTSSMDCGPAALKCLLAGHGIQVSYGRLREACQTGIDGTSIDTMETVANQLGLAAEQVMLPPDHIFAPESKSLPALVVVLLPNGITHFVVVWRRHGNMLQVMDPAVGRRWVPIGRFAKELHRHRLPAAASDWREFAASQPFRQVLQAQLASLGLAKRERARLLQDALEAASWRDLAALDAAARLTRSLVKAGAVRKSRAARELMAKLLDRPELIPERYWSVQDAPLDIGGNEQVLMSGAVLVRVKGKSAAPAEAASLDRELAAAVAEKPLHPGRELAAALWKSGPLAALLLLVALLFAGAGIALEAMLFRGLLDVTQALGLAGQRWGALAAVVLFSFALLLFEWPCFLIGGRLGRQLENRLRIRFLEKIPKLGDRYFQSRLTSDMAERSHATKRLRHLPDQVRQLLRAVCELACTAAAIVWLEPPAALFVGLILAAALLPALLAQPLLAERDLRARSHAAGLTRFYLDALAGLFAIRAHGGERNVRREQRKLLAEWAAAALSLQRAAVTLEAVQLFLMFGAVALMLLIHPLAVTGIGRVLLLVYWALNLPVLGQEIGTLLRQYPYYRNLTLRLLDPLGAPESKRALEPAHPLAAAPAITFRNVGVQVSGHSILDELNAHVEAGSHVAIVGPSGAGKSSLLGLLLGWLEPAAGEMLVDGRPLVHEEVRHSCAWVDPGVHLWNRSLLANLSYGSRAGQTTVGHAIDDSLLRSVLENLPEGMQTRLGEGGALVSGGEGQRVRFARALLRADVRLAILDEPFRGLDRDKRRLLLERARDFWRAATLLCVTHDLAETRSFDQVWVIEGGRLVEAGAPAELLAQADSRYRQLLDSEAQTRAELWEADWWRRVQVRGGRVLEQAQPHASAAGEREAEVA